MNRIIITTFDYKKQNKFLVAKIQGSNFKLSPSLGHPGSEFGFFQNSLARIQTIHVHSV